MTSAGLASICQVVRVAFIENGDSFSWNVIDRLPFGRSEVEVIDGRDAAAVVTALDAAERLVIGPGPRDPVRAGLTSLILRAAARRVPTLGICLGHQAIGLAFGACFRRATPAHGVQDVVRFAGTRWLAPLDGDYTVMRYHSLVLDDVAAPLRVVATSAGGLVMAIEHESLPIAGMQFHPDSFATADGEAMLAAFFERVG